MPNNRQKGIDYMINIEKIKFGNQEFDLVIDGVKLGESGGSITFQKGALSFEDIKTLLKNNSEISQIGLTGDPDWAREDLVYAKRLTEQSDYTVGVEEDGVTEIKTDVIIAYFKLPDLAERVTALETEKQALQETVDALVLSNLEG